MIHIFFGPGMFVSTIEMVLRSFTNYDGSLVARFRNDGSAHTFQKQHHVGSSQDLVFRETKEVITTIQYPFPDKKLPEILLELTSVCPGWEKHKKILVYAPDMKWAEINLLFQYHKVSVGLGMGLRIFGGKNIQQNIRHWNQKFDSVDKMPRWAYREWFSLFYPTVIQDWTISKHQVPDDFYTLSNQQMLECTHESLLAIIDFCGLQLRKPLNEFVMDFQSRQQYVLREYDLIEKIARSVIDSKENFSWESDLSLVGEAILQNRCRNLGFEWRCDGLDRVPKNTVDLHKILYQPLENIHA